MPRKKRVWWHARAIALMAEERSVREIADILRREKPEGAKSPAPSTVHNLQVRLREGGKPAGDAQTTAMPVQPPPPPPPPEPLDESPMEPEDLVGLLAGLLRQQTALAQRLSADGDQQGAQRAARTASSIAAQLAKQQARGDEDGDTVRVKAEDMRAAAERAINGLFTLSERVVHERASWPTCPACGLPVGTYPAADKSPLRALVERVFGRAL